ncbi:MULTISPECIES: type III secretion system gatekeeper subunit SctW [Providencia]|uniref:Type III secretion system gatekeeper subunit SctW n=3 Tax=Providencia TaxID=586 RepID=A0AA42K3G1_9GAMM|nr:MULTISPECIES: type III secretion system gatekeeper subunit SctW [Providencia]MBC8654872.1 type III secretion system gatekeeper subunit SctW [Providencia vermicola]HCI94758.1 YopN family type III secretion system gatekeeper subunit [Providencia sp.]APC09913.1 HrpJ-like domain protein [Providencia rettgeri]AVL73563.1 YopN family type III secretion system gatekeeper subunit [Providencia rettgeri]EIL1983875.1 type III secretion system gatekeeper subunit SctW [Providencia rettgeri]
MAITPLNYSNRFSVGTQDKSRASAKSNTDDSDEVTRGLGVIDSSSEYASMAMLAASHIRRGSSRKDPEEEWMRFAERILDSNADGKITQIEALLNKQLMNPRQLRTLLLQFFPDPSDLLMALASLIHRKKFKNEQIAYLETLYEQLLNEENARSAQAGANVALLAKAFAQKLKQSAGNLRSVYREFIGYDGPVVYLYEQWVEVMELQERENMMRYLARALACDLQALPLGDVNISEFGNFFIRVGRLRELQSLDCIFSQKIFQADFFRYQIDNQKLVLEKSLSQIFISGIRGLADFEEQIVIFVNKELRFMHTETRARFLQLVFLAFSTIPISVFPILESRDEILEHLKKQMNDIVAQEIIKK